MAGRRGNNEGCIYKRNDGRCCAQVSLGGRRITKYAKTQRECREWVKQTLDKIDHGLTFNGTQITLERFMESWLSGKELSRRPNTVRNYRKYCEQYIFPVLGKMLLQSILPAHLRQLYLRMQAEGRDARTIQLVHVTMHCALKQAVKEGLIGHNPVEAVERPKVETQQFQIFTEEQARTFLAVARGHRYEALFCLALTTSLRKGELFGLMWSDVDWQKGVLRVKRQLQMASWSGPVLSPTKTKSGRRQIKLGKGSLAMLEAHRADADWPLKGQCHRRYLRSCDGTFAGRSRTEDRGTGNPYPG